MSTVFGAYQRDITSKTSNAGPYGSESTIDVVCTVYRTDGATIDPTAEAEAMITAGVFTIREGFFGILPGASWEQFAVCRSYTLSQVSGKLIKVSMHFSTMYFVDPTSSSTLRYQLPAMSEYTARQRTSKIYRNGWSVSPPTGADISADIGGTNMVGGSTAVDTMVPQISIRVRATQDSSATSMLQATTLANYMGKLNSVAFMGAPIGTILCEGVSVSKTGAGTEYYEVIFEFLYDFWAHHEQVPTCEPTGRPLQGSTGPSEVKWKRMTRSTADFNAIYSGDAVLKNLIEKGYWT
jgi:hypothetical protein